MSIIEVTNSAETRPSPVRERSLRVIRRRKTDVVIDNSVDPPVLQYQGKSIVLSTEPDRLWKRIVLRSIDLTLATAGLIVSGPALIVIAATIRLSSPGPALYTSTRIGQRHKPFQMYKFRSMVDDAETLVQPGGELEDLYLADGYKIKADPRITAIGRFLRRTNLDEVPQLVNVMKGEMSICGPRPKIESECLVYGAAIDTILRVRPGLTGRWQILDQRNDVEFNDRILMEVEYALDRTVREDLTIMVKTATHMTGHRAGEY